MLYYTYTICFFAILAVLLIIMKRNVIDWPIFGSTVTFFSIFGVMQYAFCNMYSSIPAWQFNELMILNWYILNVPIEDIFFAITSSIIFYIVWSNVNFIEYWFKSKWKLLESVFINCEYFLNGKIPSIVLFFLSLLLFFWFLCFGGVFGRFQSIPAGIGFICLIYAWKTAYKLRVVFMCASIFIFAFAWDIVALNTFQWYYKNYFTGLYSEIWPDSNWFKIYRAWFPAGIFYFYISEIILFLGITEASSKYIYELRKRKI